MFSDDEMHFLILCFLLSFIFSPNECVATSWWDMTPCEVREKINQRIMTIVADTPSVWSVENRIIDRNSRKTPLRVYLPNQNQGLPVILFIQGGAWVAGSLDTVRPPISATQICA